MADEKESKILEEKKRKVRKAPMQSRKTRKNKKIGTKVKNC